MKKTSVQKIMVLFLALCILCGMLPGTGAAAVDARSISVSNEAELRDAVELGGEIIFTVGSISLGTPVRISANKTVTITGLSSNRTILKAQDDWKGGYDGIFIIEDGATVTLKNLIIDGGNTTRCVNVQGPTGHVTLDHVSVQNGNSGAGILMSGGTILANNVTFANNIADASSGTMGGAVYLTSGGKGAVLLSWQNRRFVIKKPAGKLPAGFLYICVVSLIDRL